MMMRLMALVVTAALSCGIQPAMAVSPNSLDSVVSVLPVWPHRNRNQEEPEGTAVAIKPGGYLVTNLHVVRRSVSIAVRLNDGRVLAAKFIGGDRLTDLALLKIDEDLAVLPIGRLPALAAPVCTIGNQFGLGLSVTCGVVSAVHRTGTGFNRIEDFIQTDAAVNPGASGGALVDAENHLVGILSAIFTKKSDSNLGVNFAASTRLVMRVVEDLIKFKKVIRGRAGIHVVEAPKPDRRDKVGALIEGVTAGGSGAAAGLKVNDIITKIGDRSIRKPSDVVSEINMHRIGDRIKVTVRRGDRSLTVILQLSG